MNRERERYDDFWLERTGRRGERSRRRSLQRARIAGALLERAASGGARGRRRLLDVGCGRGHVAAYFQERGFQVVGVELSATAAGEAQRAGLEVVCLDLENDPLPEGPFDAILALEVLEHLRDPRKVLDRLLAQLAPAGRLIVSLPNEFHLANRLAILLGREPFGGVADPHRYHFGRRSAAAFLRASGCEARSVRAASIVPPGWGPASALGEFLARLRPALFGICFVMDVRRARASA
jgi:2-polyprenyl-3-methyl-5-hydroxy-6-metoxy-1,4-benzoquinol methylase